MEKSNNIISFPLKNNMRKVEPNEIENNLTMVKYNHIGETLALVIPLLFNNIELAGFNIDEDESQSNINIKDGALIVESIKSFLLKHYDLYHPFQDISNEVFQETEIENEFKIKPKLEIQFKQDIDKETES